MAFARESLNKEFYTTGDVAKMFNVSPKTIQKWDARGVLTFQRIPKNRRIKMYFFILIIALLLTKFLSNHPFSMYRIFAPYFHIR